MGGRKNGRHVVKQHQLGMNQFCVSTLFFFFLVTSLISAAAVPHPPDAQHYGRVHVPLSGLLCHTVVARFNNTFMRFPEGISRGPGEVMT